MMCFFLFINHLILDEHLGNISNPKRWCCESAALNIPVNLENSVVPTGLANVSFHSNPKERQRQPKEKHAKTHTNELRKGKHKEY